MKDAIISMFNHHASELILLTYSIPFLIGYWKTRDQLIGTLAVALVSGAIAIITKRGTQTTVENVEQVTVEKGDSMTDKDRQAKRDARAVEAGKPREMPPTHNHANVQRQTPAEAAAADQPPDTEVIKAARALLGQPVRALVGGHMETIILSDYDESSDSFYGLTIRCISIDTHDIVPDLKAMGGLRAYPYTERPDYAFQFVKPGQDESVLRNLARHNAAREPEVSQ